MKNTKSFKKIWALIAMLLLLGVIIFAFNSKSLRNQYDWLTLKSEQKLDVPLENQYPDLPNGCEVTSLSMLLNYYGVKVTKLDLSQNIAHVASFTDNGQYRGNPHKGFVGYMSQANAGWCVYNEPLEQVARKYTNRIQNFTGHDFIQTMKLVSTGHPVMIITTTNFNHVSDMQTWRTAQGNVHVTPSSHACVITGFNKKARIVYVNDPFGHKNEQIPWANLERSYNQQGKQALYIK
ncbi:C39 family peptidase [Lactobacillus sp. ESL0731]|uniref:C39 family peptidase n=1 Tax=unclassified Lactobacillus TaxID=2620435 RepID=UPI0023F6CC34|nr:MULTISPECIES: C39 family peptidase [unclassified Lactobacillus]WEV50898.1 C39 family peptidase [Lactobacillus sp. ESL0700]WEV62029.1 C39 family peptidase [Lactobacillus sp. ESL0731]